MTFDDYYKQGKDFFPVENLHILLQEVEKLLGRKIKNALDLGCGTGKLIAELARYNILVKGIDTSRVAIKKAQARGVSATLGDMDKPVEGTYDLIFSKLSIAFVQNQKSFLSYVYNALQKKGVFILITPVLFGCKYTNKRIRNISVPRMQLENNLKYVFGSKSYHIRDITFFEEEGILVTYIVQKQSDF